MQAQPKQAQQKQAQQKQAPPKRGRPSQVDRGDIALTALRLFERRGYQRVTMDEVAEAASVSRTTLFRLFPSKADLVWTGAAETLGPVKERARELARQKAPLAAVVEQVVIEPLRRLDDPAAARMARRRLWLVGASLELLSYPPFAEVQAQLSATIAASISPRKAPPSLVADTLVAAAFASILWWAQQAPGVSASESVRTALASLAEATVLDQSKRARNASKPV